MHAPSLRRRLLLDMPARHYGRARGAKAVGLARRSGSAELRKEADMSTLLAMFAVSFIVCGIMIAAVFNLH